MSNPPAPAKSGMPKWLIIVLVLVALIMLGCCGGITTCALVARKAAQVAVATGDTMQQRAQEAIAAQEAAEAARVNGAGSTSSDAAGGSSGASGTAGGSGAGSSGATSGGSGVAVSSGRLPGNFPKDIPVMGGLAPTSVSMADNVKGSGMVMLSGKVARDDVNAYYQKELKDQGWTMANNLDLGETTTMLFTKDTRKATVQTSMANNLTSVTVIYENTP